MPVPKRGRGKLLRTFLIQDKWENDIKAKFEIRLVGDQSCSRSLTDKSHLAHRFIMGTGKDRFLLLRKILRPIGLPGEAINKCTYQGKEIISIFGTPKTIMAKCMVNVASFGSLVV